MSSIVNIILKQNNVYVIKFLRIPKTDKEMTEYLNKLDTLYLPKKPFFCIYDTTNITETVPWEYISQQATFMKAHKELTRRYMVMAVIICTSPIIRFTINAIFLMIPPSTEVEVVGNMALAMRYINVRKRRIKKK